jgi:imidazolonepropionase
MSSNLNKLVVLHAHVFSASTTDLVPVKEMPILDNDDQAIIVEDGLIKAVVPSSEAPLGKEWRVVDVGNRLVVPGLVDSHTHSVFAGDRAGEFHARILGETYSEQQAKGGINATVEATRNADSDILLRSLTHWLGVFLRHGSTCVEVKSGYGLSHEQEIRLLRVIEHAKGTSKVRVDSTYLGAHAVPRGIAREKYIDEMINTTLPAIKSHNLAEFVDAFIARVGYTPNEADLIYGEAYKLGFKLKAHLWELEHDNSRFLLEKYPFTSIDHLEFAQRDDLSVAFGKGTVPVLLPLTAWHFGSDLKQTYAFIKALNGYFAVSTDFNPGTSFVPSLWQAIAIAHIAYGIPVRELLLAATVYGARALSRTDVGAILPNKKADFVVLSFDSLYWIGYLHGINPVDMVFVNGRRIFDRRNEDGFVQCS